MIKKEKCITLGHSIEKLVDRVAIPREMRVNIATKTSIEIMIMREKSTKI